MVKTLQFHRIASKVQFCGTWNRPKQFERFLNFIRAKEIKTALPGEDDGVIVTFDDGEKSIYNYAFPLLKKFGIKAVVFLIVAYVGKRNVWDITLTGKHVQHLTWDEVLEMKDYGILFGSHTMRHRNLTKLNKEELEYELFESKRIIEDKIGECHCVSYPFNRVNARVIQAASQAGYRFGFGGDGSSNLQLKKEALYITDNDISFGVKIFEKPKYVYNYLRCQQTVINYFTIATMLKRKR